MEEVKGLHKELKDIEEKLLQQGVAEDDRALEDRYADMLLENADNSTTSPEKLVTRLLTRCLLWAQLIEQRQVARFTSCQKTCANIYPSSPGFVGEGFRDTFDKLLAIRTNLESRSLLQAWSLRETDLYDYQRQLDRVDEARTADGNFINREGVAADLQTQRVRQYQVIS
jgi:Protein of unknown function (DUF2408)